MIRCVWGVMLDPLALVRLVRSWQSGLPRGCRVLLVAVDAIEAPSPLERLIVLLSMLEVSCRWRTFVMLCWGGGGRVLQYAQWIQCSAGASLARIFVFVAPARAPLCATHFAHRILRTALLARRNFALAGSAARSCRWRGKGAPSTRAPRIYCHAATALLCGPPAFCICAPDASQAVCVIDAPRTIHYALLYASRNKRESAMCAHIYIKVRGVCLDPDCGVCPSMSQNRTNHHHPSTFSQS